MRSPGQLSVRARLLWSGLLTFLLVLVAVVVSSFGYAAIQRASDATLFHAHQSTTMQTLIKDINQLVMTEGAKAVRARLDDTMGVLSQQFDRTAGAGADEAGRKAAASWAEVRAGIDDLLKVPKISLENDEALGKVVKLQARLDGLAGEVGQLADSKRAESERIARRVVGVVGGIFAAILLLVAVVFVLLHRSLQRQLGAEPAAVKGLVHRVAGGDLTVAIATGAGVPQDSLLASMGEMTGKLTGVVHSIDDTNRAIAQAAFQISLLSRELADSNLRQETRMREVSAATDELATISSTVGELTEAARGRAAATEAQAAEGLRVVQESVGTMQHTVGQVGVADVQLQELSGAAAQINQIIESISAIAAQTNLLSLNAAIEAARAGEQGRGFAVVADEVRKLANRTTEATAEITRIVGALTGRLEQARISMGNVVASAGESNDKALATGQVIERMVQQVRASDAGNIDIVRAAQTQAERLKVLNSTLESLFRSLRENQSKTGVTHQISDGLYHTVEHVTQQLSFFVFDRTHEETPRDHEHRRYPRSHNPLLVTVDCDGQESRAIADDFSVSGMRLRSCGALVPPACGRVRMQLLRPQASFESFTAQQPVRLDGRIVWRKEDGDDWLYGIEFDHRTPEQEREIANCFEFFRSNAYFAAGT